MYIVYEHLQTNTNMSLCAIIYNYTYMFATMYIVHVHKYVLKYYCAQLCSVHVHCTVHQNKKKPTMYLYSKKY